MPDTPTSLAPVSDGLTAYALALREHLDLEHQIGQRPGALEGLDLLALEKLHGERHPGVARAAAGHVHVRDEFDPSFVHCPQCGCLELKTGELVPAVSPCTITLGPPGQAPEIDWTDTDIRDGSETVTDSQGRIELWCASCSHSWYDDRVRRPGFKPDPGAAHVVAAVALRATLGQWLDDHAIRSSLKDQAAVNELDALLARFDSADPVVEVIVKVEDGIAEVVEKPGGVDVVIIDVDPEAENAVRLGGAVAAERLKAGADVLALLAEAAR